MSPNDPKEKDTSPPSLRRPNFLDFDSSTLGFELNRSMSAPPAEFLTSIQNLIDDNEDEPTSNRNQQGNSFTNDPSYAAYFYSNSRFDPRLPPPSFYSPGQSWQMWPSSVNRNNPTNIGGNLRHSQQISQRQEAVDHSESSGYSQRKKLVDMIQEDFPRTPSPVHHNYGQQASQGQQSMDSAKGIHLLGDPSIDQLNVKIGKTARKPFSISGSVDAVMAAAIQTENDIEINFGMQKLKLFPTVEEDEEINQNQSIEPFTFAENYVPFASVSVPPSLNSAPARSFNSTASAAYNVYNGSIVYPDENLKQVIMEDFRTNRSKRYELFDLKGMMIDFSTDQHGSRFIQQKLETSSEAEKEAVFNEVYPVALQLMTDVFGNYVIQKFFEYGSRDHRIALAHVMHGHVLNLSLQMYGCRVVQKALEHVPSDEQIRLVQELEGHVLKCVKDQNGNHVIQKCIECVPLKTSAPFLTASFLSQASTLAMHPYGCRVIQRIFEHGPPEHSHALLDELLKNTGTLIQDQYGNYVIQHVLEHGHPSERSRIIKFLQGRLLEYSRHKFASNVVEKCVSFGTESERQELIEEILTPIPIEESENGTVITAIPLHLMMKDQFANYVVQKLLEIVDGEQREMLLECIKPQLFQLKKYTYGKHILAKVEKMLGMTPSEPVIISGVSGVGIASASGYHYQQHHHSHHNPHQQHHHIPHPPQHHHNGHYHSAPSSPVTKSHEVHFLHHSHQQPLPHHPQTQYYLHQPPPPPPHHFPNNNRSKPTEYHHKRRAPPPPTPTTTISST